MLIKVKKENLKSEKKLDKNLFEQPRNERFLDVKQVAERLGIAKTNTQKIYNAINNGYIKASRTSKTVVREGWLNNFIIEHEGEDISYMFK